MNERIRELESQCWEPRQYGPPWFNSEKFAELIVEKCKLVINEIDAADTSMTIGLYRAAAAIGKHFGVEE